MTKKQTNLLRDALAIYVDYEIAVCERYPKVPFEPTQSFKNTISSYEKLAETREKAYLNRIKAWKIVAVAALISALLLVTACTVGKPIIRFFKEVFNTHTEISADYPDAPRLVEEILSCSGIPSGYDQVEQKCLDFICTTRWSDGNEDIILTQQTIEKSYIFVNTENTEMNKCTVGDVEAFYSLKFGSYTFVFEKHQYLFILACPESLSWEEIEALIVGIE